MQVLPWLNLVIWSSLCTTWGLILWQQRKLYRPTLWLPEPEWLKHDEHPAVEVIIPACNEADTIGRCLASVSTQDWPNLKVRVVNDRSADETRAVLACLSEHEMRLRVTDIHELPTGWMGKSHALWRGASQSDADWLLFLDADCELLRVDAIRTAVCAAKDNRWHLLTLWPRQRLGGFWEGLLIPLCSAIIALWFGSDRVNNPTSNAAFANGQFLLINRKAYQSIDGHRAVADALIEDIPLAEHAKARGLRCHVACGRDLVTVRMYTSLAAIWCGWARIFVGALRSSVKLWLSILWLLATSLLPTLAAPVVLVATCWTLIFQPGEVTTLDTATAAHAAMYLVLLMAVSYRFWQIGGCDRRYLWLYPLSAIGVIGILLQAWWWLAVRGQIKWRTSTYTINHRGIITQGLAPQPATMSNAKPPNPSLTEAR